MIIAFANQKGGVGKTTTAVTLAAGLAARGKKTLLVDLDSQGHAALSLGLEKSSGIFRLLCENEPLSSLVLNARENLDVLPSDKHTEQVKRSILQGKGEPDTDRLKNALKRTAYDVILIDMAPSMDALHLNGLNAADWVVIPTRLDTLSLDGVNEILLTMGEVTCAGHRFTGFSILPTFFERSTRETLTQFQMMVRTFGANVLPPIPQDARLREAVAYGKTAWEYAPNSPAVKGYLEGNQLVGGYEQILSRIEEDIL